jgi:uncharacterized lipoprotein YehR (DUF1307 family)
MRRLVVLMLALLTLTLTGCGGQEERGKYKNRDRPVAPK